MGEKNRFLTQDEKKRYHRQITLPGWGEEGQRKLRKTTVFIAGAGGLGSAVAMYLSAAGIGSIRICDSGKVEHSNLNRQILHSSDAVGEKKTDSAVRAISRLNPHVEVEPLYKSISADTVTSLVGDATILIDCLDNFSSRYILNAHAVRMQIPLIHAGVYGFSGQATFIHSPETPCFRCIFPETPQHADLPVVGTTTGILGCIEAQEALKYLTGKGRLLKSRLLIWDGDGSSFEEIHVEKNPECEVCGKTSAHGSE
jgi:adenylyltransferase/sulfurtransferase